MHRDVTDLQRALTDACNDHDLVTIRRLLKKMGCGAREILRADETDNIYYQVLGESGEFVSGDRDLPLPPEEDANAGSLVQLRDDHIHGAEIRVAYTFVQRPGMTGGKPALVQVAETLDKRAQLANEIIKGVILPQFVILPLAVILVWFGLTRGLAPLNAIQERIRARNPGDTSPIDEGAAPQELTPLVASFNDLLGRLEQSVHTQKRFIADAAHQMKTPLAGLRTQAEPIPVTPRMRTPVSYRSTWDDGTDLFRDPRARRTGDVVTVKVVELIAACTSASKSPSDLFVAVSAARIVTRPPYVNPRVTEIEIVTSCDKRPFAASGDGKTRREVCLGRSPACGFGLRDPASAPAERRHDYPSEDRRRADHQAHIDVLAEYDPGDGKCAEAFQVEQQRCRCGLHSRQAEHQQQRPGDAARQSAVIPFFPPAAQSTGGAMLIVSHNADSARDAIPLARWLSERGVAGFVLRAVAGVELLRPVAPEVQISSWLLVCTFFGALFLGVSKRSRELHARVAGSHAHHCRGVHDHVVCPLHDLARDRGLLARLAGRNRPDACRRGGALLG